MSTALPAHVDPARVVDINIYDLPGQADDFHGAWKALQDSSPDIIWTPQNEGHWIALRGDVLAEVQSDHERFSNRVIVIPKSVGELHGLIPSTIDPPEHRPYRLLLNAELAPSAIRGMKERIRETANELIDSFIADGRCDFTAQFAQVFPIRIFMKLMGVPMEDAAKIKMWAESMTRPEPVMPFEDARAAFFAYVAPMIAERRAAPGDDLISRVVTADIGGRTLDDEEANSIITQVLIAGVDTVVNFLSFALLHLARNPDTAAALAASDSRDVLTATHEIFRRFGLVTIARTIKQDIVFHGVQLKAGELICIPTQVHGLDERINECPMTLDLNRKKPRHSAFGSGIHMCPGQELARAEVAITIEEWLRRIPRFRVAADADTRASGGLVGQINRLVLEWDA